MMNNGKVVPTPKIIDQLRATIDGGNSRAYWRLIKQIDWTLAEDAEILDQGIGLLIAVGLCVLRARRSPSSGVVASIPEVQLRR